MKNNPLEEILLFNLNKTFKIRFENMKNRNAIQTTVLDGIRHEDVNSINFYYHLIFKEFMDN